MFLKIFGIGWVIVQRLAQLVVKKVRKNHLISVSQIQKCQASSPQISTTPCPQIQDKSSKIFSVAPRKFKYRVIDLYGNTCYDGDDYEKAREKIRWLPTMMALYMLDNTNNIVAALWSAPGTGILSTRLDTLIPN